MSERQMHWAVAVPFMVCYATALVLMGVYSQHPQRPFRSVVSWTHRVSGVGLFLLPVWCFLRHWYDVAIHLDNIREVWRWTVDDLKWLFLMVPATLSKKILLPEQGKFNAAEKINFMMLTTGVPLYLITGAMIWSHQYAFPAWLVHLGLASTATPLLFGHLFMAIVNPDTRVGLSGMFSGYVSRDWASHHYTRWYRENFADPVIAPAPDTGEARLAASHPQPENGRGGHVVIEFIPHVDVLVDASAGPDRPDVPRFRADHLGPRVGAVLPVLGAAGPEPAPGYDGADRSLHIVRRHSPERVGPQRMSDAPAEGRGRVEAECRGTDARSVSGPAGDRRDWAGAGEEPVVTSGGPHALEPHAPVAARDAEQERPDIDPPLGLA